MSDTLISIFTLYNWDNTIFDNMTIPPELDKDILVDNLIIELAEFGVLYTDPDFMKLIIEMWSKKELKIWQDEYNTTILEYNPIENYNRTELSTDTETRALNKTGLETRALASTGGDVTVVDSENNRSGNDQQVKSTSAYNEQANFTDREKDITTLGTKEETDSTVTVTLNGTDTGTVNNTEADNGTVTTGRDANMKGNIGVTTTQQMIDQERKSVEFNIYDYIIASFKMRYCITVY